LGAFRHIDNEFIGWFMLKDTRHGIPELGFMLPRKMWRQGFAFEGSQLIIEKIKKEKVVAKIMATTHFENLASIHILKKLGMTETVSPSVNSVLHTFELYLG